MADNLTKAQRSHCMSMVKNKNTKLEMVVRAELQRRGFRFRKHAKDLPGKPDVVFRKAKVAVFVDGDFWHGYQFYKWERKLSEFWRIKIGKTRQRDQRNFRKLRRLGWRVIRLWEHEIQRDFEACLRKIGSVLLPEKTTT